ncbi:MAG: Eisosome component PIL1-domain-containing protein, partial [Benjaminiella poitrasii]
IQGKYQQYRHAIKSIREREEKLSNQRERKRSLQTRIANLVKTSPKSPRIAEFEKELNVLQRDTQGSEMDLADFKRFALKEAFYLRFNAMHEYGHKLALVAGFGKYLTDLIDAEPTTTETRKRYEKGPEAQEIIDDAVEALREWKPMAGDERPTLADGKGKSPSLMSSSSELATPTSKIPPKLPPRRPSQRPSIMSGASSSSSLSPPPPNATGDLKTEPDIQIDLYDPPPPAYDNPASPTFSYQGSSAASSRISPATITDSPVPMHRPLPPPQPQEPYSPIYNPINYEQLYHQQQHQQQSNHHRPY